jgi:hypothetical protein
MGKGAEGEEGSEETLVNWTEILRKGGVPDAPGYQELQAQMREEKACQPIDTVPQKKRRRKKK